MPNFIPAYAFSNVVGGVTKGKATLEKVILSEKTKNIEDAAFKGCENLKICQIRKKTAPNLLPEALADSVTAIFVPLGSSDSYRYKEAGQRRLQTDPRLYAESRLCRYFQNERNSYPRLHFRTEEVSVEYEITS